MRYSPPQRNRCRSRVAFWATLSLLLWPLQSRGEEHQGAFETLVRPVFQKKCVKCHGLNKKVEGKANLLQLKSADALKKDPELLQALIDALEYEAMPPEEEPVLAPKTRQQLVTYFKQTLHAVVNAKKSYSQSPLRRMNRFQYSNAVQDLFDLDRVVFTLPEKMCRDHGNYFQPASGKMPDEVKVGSRPLGKSQLIEKRLAGVAAFPQDLRAEHGYDNRGDHLSLSPLLLESFMTLSRSIVESPDFNAGSVGLWKIFFAEPPNSTNLESTVRTRLQLFLMRAFRRPVSEEMLERYTKFVLRQVASGKSLTDSMKSAASAVIASPKFLYLYESASPGTTAQPLDDFELASRLSFFLWGSIPDEALLELASLGTLSDAEVLCGQVDRMLDDKKLKRFCDSFPSQWLQLERIVSSVPNREHFPGFYFSKYRSSMHLMLEPLLLFETVLIEDRTILDLIDSDFSYRSDRIESLWYGNDSTANKATGAVSAIPFHRVKLTDRRQGGVITNAAVMTMTSGSEESKPITRGAWIATVIFNDPPEPPPADVPPLDEKPPTEEANMTLRERLALHRERADCAGCHEKIDPFGFALENYDAIGKWRDEYENGRKIDMSGSLFRTQRFTTIPEFKDAILAEKDRFARGFSAHLMSFALAREVNAADSTALEQIVSNTQPRNYRLQELIKEIVLSEPFRTKSNPAVASSRQLETATPTSVSPR